MTIREQILQDALSLPPEDRAFVADHLEQSLQSGEFASPEIAAAWTKEIDRRIEAYSQGKMEASDAAAAIKRMRASRNNVSLRRFLKLDVF